MYNLYNKEGLQAAKFASPNSAGELSRFKYNIRDADDIFDELFDGSDDEGRFRNGYDIKKAWGFRVLLSMYVCI